MEGRAGRRWAFTGEASVTVGDGIFYGPAKWWDPPPAPLFLRMRDGGLLEIALSLWFPYCSCGPGVFL
jgi:hypothetical protein